MMDKETLEKARLAQRREGFHRYEDPGRVAGADGPESASYMSEPDRFVRDVAGEEKLRREDMAARKAVEVLRRREDVRCGTDALVGGTSRVSAAFDALWLTDSRRACAGRKSAGDEWKKRSAKRKNACSDCERMAPRCVPVQEGVGRVARQEAMGAEWSAVGLSRAFVGARAGEEEQGQRAVRLHDARVQGDTRRRAVEVRWSPSSTNLSRTREDPVPGRILFAVCH